MSFRTRRRRAPPALWVRSFSKSPCYGRIGGGRRCPLGALVLAFHDHPIFATAGLQYLHRPFLSRMYFQTDTRLFMGGFLSALGTYPEILGEYYITTVTC